MPWRKGGLFCPMHQNDVILVLVSMKTKVMFVSRNSFSGKSLSKLYCVCLTLEKLVNGKHFPVKEKFGLVFRKVFSFYFGRKTFSRSCEKFRNIILFADYIKSGLQTFDCYIYFFWIFLFQFHPLEFYFDINFNSHFYNCYLFFP